MTGKIFAAVEKHSLDVYRETEEPYPSPERYEAVYGCINEAFISVTQDTHDLEAKVLVYVSDIQDYITLETSSLIYDKANLDRWAAGMAFIYGLLEAFETSWENLEGKNCILLRKDNKIKGIASRNNPDKVFIFSDNIFLAN